MSKWNNPLKPFQEKHFQKGQVYLRLAIIYMGALPLTWASKGVGSFFKKMLVMCVRNHLIYLFFLRGSVLVLRSKAAKSLVSQKPHCRFMYISFALTAALQVVLAFRLALLWICRRICLRALLASVLEES